MNGSASIPILPTTALVRHAGQRWVADEALEHAEYDVWECDIGTVVKFAPQALGEEPRFFELAGRAVHLKGERSNYGEDVGGWWLVPIEVGDPLPEWPTINDNERRPKCLDV